MIEDNALHVTYMRELNWVFGIISNFNAAIPDLVCHHHFGLFQLCNTAISTLLLRCNEHVVTFHIDEVR